MSTNLGMTSPNTASDMTVTELLQKVYDNKAYLESVKPDPIFNNRDLIHTIAVGDRQAVPSLNSFFVNVTPKNTGARSLTLAFIAALTMDPIEGNEQFIGNEGDFEMKWTQCFANDWAGGVTLQKFGIDARELKNYGLNENAKRLLFQWRTEILGYYAREALVQRISHNLTAAPLSQSQTYNKNWWFPSLSDANQPSFNATAATQASNIGTAAAAAGMSGVLTPSYLLQMIDYLEESYLRPVMLNGKPMWLMMVCPREMRRLRDPGVTGSFGAYFKDAAAITDVNKVIPTAELVVADSLVLVKDRRNPTMVYSGSGSTYTLSFGYDKAGRTGTKTTGVSAAGSTEYWNINTVMGDGALMWYEPEKTHEEKQPDEYTQYEGDALFQAIGYQTPVWNVDSASQDSDTAQQESSWIVPTIKA